MATLNSGAFSLLLALSCQFIARTAGHGMILDPPSRSSLWRFEEFAMHEPLTNYEDNQLWCGGLNNYIQNGLKCGLCGDPFNDTVPRENEDGGKYDLGVISRYYKAGQTFTAEVALTQSHLGFWQIKLCPDYPITEECFNQHVLTFPEHGGSDKFQITSEMPNQKFKIQVKLPDGLQCSRCVIQWEYVAGNNWGTCENGTYATGCGPQETFRNCADVTIL